MLLLKFEDFIFASGGETVGFYEYSCELNEHHNKSALIDQQCSS